MYYPRTKKPHKRVKENERKGLFQRKVFLFHVIAVLFREHGRACSRNGPSLFPTTDSKSGPLPAERYDEKLFNQSAFRDWLLLKVVYRENVTVPAPMSYRCGVFVNHDYKLIFIRNRKAASTTVLDTFKTACKSQKVMCMKPFSEEEMEARGLTHDAMWNSYYVISSTRNPWARAASGYDYAQDRRVDR
ncbi:hypothetical protein VOLCADRAFT_99408 [Volvox carteri f. nagariensis]|uniref:Carbohydrate sulfotransferase n=1 Tax=Volvox carteri f. nagariensis TaxID=3068 RepID=D8UHQ6_VOLCA|nr:uncharacterized protein VOLCADRAFT_99408 [Volvox carteri f. nagariensis]EFJ40720.1 hypothetical protein VOLCADRAFT_99408 [Volvox carteri f. nagariensis]|eukprot:XP_002958186.1 hypothetical protein VOLCADRAFT_99408 [Volvox carteri f. nagariensis]